MPNKVKRKRKIHTDKHGRDFIKESYFVGGKMKIRRVYVIDGIPEQEFYERNATDIDHFKNGEYWLAKSENDADDVSDISDRQDYDFSDIQEQDVSGEKWVDLPF
jgi:hypothetical protein